MPRRSPPEAEPSTSAPPPPRAPSLHLYRWFPFALLLISILLIYSDTLDVPWHFDDTHNIVERKALHLKELSREGLRDALFKGKRLYRPLSCLSFALNYYVHRLDVRGYHVVNIGIHVLAAWFLFLFIKVTLQGPFTRVRNPEKAFFISLMTALLWAVHPIQTQAVTYIVQRMASLAGMFYIASLYFYARARIREKGNRRRVFLFLSLLAALLALGSKENTILLVAAVFFYEGFVLGFSPLRQGLGKKGIPVLLVLAAAAAAVVGYVVLMRGGHVFSMFNTYDDRIFSLPERLLSEPRILFLYLSLLFYPLPQRLSICHDVVLSSSLIHPVTTLISIGLAVLLIAAAFRFRKAYPLIAFSVLFFFLNHAVESTVVPLELVFEHRNYIPSMLIFLPPALLLAKILWSPALRPGIRRAVGVFVILLPLALGSASYIRNMDWKTAERLWKDAAAKNPGTWRPFHNVGIQYLEKGDAAEALSWFRRALEKKNTTLLSEKHQTLYNMGVAYRALGREEEALSAYRLAVEMYPDMVQPYVNIGVILMDREEFEAAQASFLKAVTLDPSLPEAQSNLGWVLFKSGDPVNGLDHLRKAVRLAPGHVVNRKRLAYLLLRIGSLGEAEKEFVRLRHARPHDVSSLLFLAEVYERTERPAKAKAALRQTLRTLGKDSSSLIQALKEQKDHLSDFLPDIDLLVPMLTDLAAGAYPSP